MNSHQLLLSILFCLLFPIPTGAQERPKTILVVLTKSQLIPEDRKSLSNTLRNRTIEIASAINAAINPSPDKPSFQVLYTYQGEPVKRSRPSTLGPAGPEYTSTSSRFSGDIDTINLNTNQDNYPNLYLDLKHLAIRTYNSEQPNKAHSNSGEQLYTASHAIVVIQPEKETNSISLCWKVFVMGVSISALPKSLHDPKLIYDSKPDPNQRIAELVALRIASIDPNTANSLNNPSNIFVDPISRIEIKNFPKNTRISVLREYRYLVIPRITSTLQIYQSATDLTTTHAETFFTKIDIRTNPPPKTIDFLTDSSRKPTWRRIVLGSMVSVGLAVTALGAVALVMTEKCMQAPSAYECAGHYPTALEGGFALGLGLTGAIGGLVVPLAKWYADRRWLY